MNRLTKPSAITVRGIAMFAPARAEEFTSDPSRNRPELLEWIRSLSWLGTVHALSRKWISIAVRSPYADFVFRAPCLYRRPGLFDRLRSCLLALAAVTLLSYQPLDSIGHVASEAYEAGNHSLIVRAMAAFDVLDDTLDHAPDRDHAPTAQQQVIVGLPCCAKAEPMVFVALAGTWTIAHSFLPPNQILSELFRPPRG